MTQDIRGEDCINAAVSYTLTRELGVLLSIPVWSLAKVAEETISCLITCP